MKTRILKLIDHYSREALEAKKSAQREWANGGHTSAAFLEGVAITSDWVAIRLAFDLGIADPVYFPRVGNGQSLLTSTATTDRAAA